MKSPVLLEKNYPVLPRHGACLVCRKRKLKCDAKKPECNECIVTNRKCLYEDESYRSRTHQLKDRIKELEAKIRAAEQGIPFSRETLGSASSSSGVHSSHTSGSPKTPPASYQTQPLPPDFTIDGSPSWSAELMFPSTKTITPDSFEPTFNVYEPPKAKEQEAPPPDVTRSLLAIFVLRQAQCGFELHMGRVIASLCPGAPEPIVPALFSAMLLLACHFSQGENLKAWEGRLLERTKEEINDNITRAHGEGEGKYNAAHHLQAMCLLAHYYLFKGRLLEGCIHSSNAARFAVTLGFHQLNSRVVQPVAPANQYRSIIGVQRWQPSDAIELGEAINLWWVCTTLDFGAATLNGLPLSVDVSDITTVWPRPIDDFEDSSTLPDDNYSVAALLDPDLPLSDISHDNFKYMMAKASIVLLSASKLNLERVANPQGSDDWWVRFDACDRTVARFMQTMPPVNLARNVEELACLILVHTAIYCATVQLHSILAEMELILGAQGDLRGLQPDGTLGGLSYMRCTEACRAAALAALVIADIDFSYMHMFIGLAWVCVTEVLTREVPRLRNNGNWNLALEKERQLGVMERCMEKLVATYPILSLQVEQLRSLKTW
ncbi:hypothetical protein BDV93DRAFT_245111 [Ceratobasidium sp. AG-I]|nr:hypothetical protein BDV93DRAFT_245111 [Ceratobasidium sp. AG-I]